MTLLAGHLSECAKHAIYHSMTTQNGIIDILDGMITEKVIARLGKLKF